MTSTSSTSTTQLNRSLGALALELRELRVVGGVGEYGVEELVHGVVVSVDLLRQTFVELGLLVVSQPVGQHTLTYQIAVGVEVTHVARVGVQLLDVVVTTNMRTVSSTPSICMKVV